MKTMIIAVIALFVLIMAYYWHPRCKRCHRRLHKLYDIEEDDEVYLCYHCGFIKLK